jgi:tetratricopeptide (TPR) repeat protein
MDPDNPIVKLCAEGMQAEYQGRFDLARALFTQAWEARQNDLDACIAAHFLARQQESPEETLRWNEIALRSADAAGDERVHGFYPSLYLNLGFSHEVLGNLAEASRFYGLAEERISELDDGPYGNVVRNAIAQGLRRIGAADDQDP